MCLRGLGAFLLSFSPEPTAAQDDEKLTMKEMFPSIDDEQMTPLPYWQGRNSFVRDNCHLLAGTVLPEGAVVPPFTVVSVASSDFFMRHSCAPSRRYRVRYRSRVLR